MIPTLALLFIGAVSAEGVEMFRPAPSCSSTGVYTITYPGHPMETDINNIDREHRDDNVNPTTITYTGCPIESTSVGDGEYDDDFDNMSMDMGELDIMFKPGLHTITRNDVPATTFTTTMVVSEASDNSFWESTVVQTIVVVSGTGSRPAEATGESGSSGNSGNGNGNAASRQGDMAALKAMGGVIAGGVLLLAFM